MDEIVHKFIEVNGLKLHIAEIGNESSPAVVFLHGFPEICGRKRLFVEVSGMQEYLKSEELKKYVHKLEIIYLAEGCHFVQEQFPNEPTMDEIVRKFIEVNGVKLHIAEIGNESSPAVVFLHGFPEIWYSWRHQMMALAKAGYRAIAPDFRGYGLSDPPHDINKFCFSDLVDDVLAMVDLLAIDKVPSLLTNVLFMLYLLQNCVLSLGKHFGVRPAFLFALLYPTRVAGVVSLGVPHAPFVPRKFQIELPEGFYITRWKEPGRAEADFARLDAKTVVKNVYILFSRSEIPIAGEGQEIMDIISPSTPLPSWFTEDDLSVYGALYEKCGFLNSLKVPYRSTDEVYDIADQVIKNPMLVILGEKDYFLKFPGVEDFIKSGTVNHFATSLEIQYVPEGSHFVQEQFPHKINSLILAFLKLLRSKPTTLREAFSLARITEARFEDERSTTTIAKPNDLNIGVHVKDLEETTRHKPNKVEAIKSSGSSLLMESKYYADNQVGLIFNQSNEAIYFERILELIANYARAESDTPVVGAQGVRDGLR
uniref:Bifunctional epoxide hydrolase 2-like n=1 Tax=Tanacetum cinerariifolium TaxID=118510 RepID=A0A6L2NB25_TANCI|nr:bifunctional epoxide hydrolase 2-like [Tanacetum cinerariifolium]